MADDAHYNDLLAQIDAGVADPGVDLERLESEMNADAAKMRESAVATFGGDVEEVEVKTTASGVKALTFATAKAKAAEVKTAAAKATVAAKAAEVKSAAAKAAEAKTADKA